MSGKSLRSLDRSLFSAEKKAVLIFGSGEKWDRAAEKKEWISEWRRESERETERERKEERRIDMKSEPREDGQTGEGRLGF